MQDPPYPPRPLTDLELGWVAGLYEGEGCCVLGTSRYVCRDGTTGATGARASISMTDRDVIERLEALWPCTNGVYVRQKVEKPGYKTQYVWRIGRRDHIVPFLRAILPFLGERRTEQALAILAYLEDPEFGRKSHCVNGHPYDEANTLWRKDSASPRGFVRQCRICKNAAWRRAYHRRKARTQAAG